MTLQSKSGLYIFLRREANTVTDRLANKGRSQQDKVFVYKTCIIFIYEKYIRNLGTVFK